MGNLCSSSVKYRPGPANSRPNNYIVMHNLAGREYPQPFYVDFDDEWSLDQQLRYYNMIGIIIQPTSQAPGFFALLLSERDHHIPTRFLLRGEFDTRYDPIYPDDPRYSKKGTITENGPEFINAMKDRRTDYHVLEDLANHIEKGGTASSYTHKPAADDPDVIGSVGPAGLGTGEIIHGGVSEGGTFEGDAEDFEVLGGRRLSRAVPESLS